MTRSLIFKNRQRARPVPVVELRKLTLAVLRNHLRCQNYELVVYLVGSAEMTRVNEHFLRHSGSTDVITFDYCDPANPNDLNGELFICVDEAVIQARQYHTTWKNEVIRYIVHGILHLLGFDDRTKAARRKMKTRENKIVAALTAKPVRLKPAIGRAG